jgi:hypothetical protein
LLLEKVAVIVVAFPDPRFHSKTRIYFQYTMSTLQNATTVVDADQYLEPLNPRYHNDVFPFLPMNTPAIAWFNWVVCA